MKTTWSPTLTEKIQSMILSRNSGVSTLRYFRFRTTTCVLQTKSKSLVTDVTLDDRLHVDAICNRTFRQIIFFKWFSKYSKIDRRLSVCKSFIQSNFSSCPLAWLFCGRTNGNKLEKLQERALRIFLVTFFIEIRSSVRKGQCSASFFLSSSFLYARL